MSGAVPLTAARFHPPPFKPRVQFSCTRLTDGLLVQHARIRVAYHPTQPQQALTPEPFSRPLLRLTGTEPLPPLLHHETAQPVGEVTVELVELPGRIPGAEVVGPSLQHRVQVADDHPHILHPMPSPVRQLSNPRPHPLHAPHRRPPLEVVAANALSFQQQPRQALPQVTAEELKAFLP